MREQVSTMENSIPKVCKSSKQAGRFKQRFIAQFGRPTGFWGKVAGTIMAHRPSNRERNYWTVALLDIQPGDRVLEIGFGPGLALERVSRMVVNGFVAGIDHSEVMLRQAQKRNAKAIREGRVDLRMASVAALPSYPKPFDKILAVNSVQFWPDPVENLKMFRQILKPGGRIALTFQPRNPGATEEDAQRAGREILANLSRAGFSQVSLKTLPLKPVSAVCVLGVH